jgi:hypothetical protein
MSSEAQEKGAPYGPGGWRSRARVQSRPDVVRAVQMAARGGERADGPAPAGDAKLLEAYVVPLSGSVKANPDKKGRWWYKLAWATPTGRVYLASSYDGPVTFYAALVDLCEQLEECHRGLRKPSPDRYTG